MVIGLAVGVERGEHKRLEIDMKIELEIPDGTLCAFFDFVYRDEWGCSMKMQGHSISSDELYDGAEIKIEPAGIGGD